MMAAGRGGRCAMLTCSQTTGVRMAGFMDLVTGRFDAVTTIQTPFDIDRFMEDYDVAVLSTRYI